METIKKRYFALLLLSIAFVLPTCGGGGGGGGSTSTLAAPTNLSATTKSSSDIELSWDYNGTSQWGFKIEMKEGANGSYSQIALKNAPHRTHLVSGLKASTTYYFRVCAYYYTGTSNSEVNSDYSNEASATTISSLIANVLKQERSDSLPYSYYFYIPSSALAKPIVGIVSVAVSIPSPTTSYSEVELYSLQALDHLKPYAEPTGLIILAVSVPREEIGVDWNQTGSAQILARTNFETAIGIHYRPDLKFIDSVNHFKSLLAGNGFVVDPQIFMTGYSAGGGWTQRFPLLHPDLIKAAAPGNNGMWTMPLSSYNGTLLNYFIGVNDLVVLGVDSSDPVSFKKIPFFIFYGSEDTNDPLDCGVGNGCYTLDWNQIVFYKNSFGNSLVDRATSFHNQLINLGMSSTLKIYPGLGHAWDDEMKTDIMNFFKSIPLNHP